MGKNFVAIILPEYVDSGNQNITSADWSSQVMFVDKTINEHIKNISTFVSFFENEGCEVVYDSKNIKAYLFPIRTLPECYPSRERLLMISLKRLADWRNQRESDPKEEYLLNSVSIKDEIRTEFAHRKGNNTSDSFVVTFMSDGFKNTVWELTKNGNLQKIEGVPMSVLDVFNWLSKHHKPERIYNWNQKHGENGKGAHPDNKGEKVSLLECSREHAADLLHKAIGEPNWDTLYCYDDEVSKYMEYKAECKFEKLTQNATQRSYHSFHIDETQKIPESVLRKIETLKDLESKRDTK